MVPESRRQHGKFGCNDLLAAGASVHKRWEVTDSEGNPGPDEASKRYRHMIEGDRPYNLDLILPVLTSWGAHRGTGSGAMMRGVLARLVSERQDELDRLRRLTLLRISGKELEIIRGLVGWLERRRFKPTAWGKSLHMLVPNAVLLWDRKVVRGRYDLPEDIEGYLAYQRYGQRLAASLGSGLAQLPSRHAEVAGFVEPIPKILDELAFDWDGSARAVLSLGGHAAAFE